MGKEMREVQGRERSIIMAWTETPKCKDCAYRSKDNKQCKLKQCKYINKR